MKTKNRALLMVIFIVSLLMFTACGSASTPTAVKPKEAILGSWTSTVTKDDILRIMPDFEPQFLCDNTGTFVWKFNADGTFTIDQTMLPDCPAAANPHIEDQWSVDGSVITFAPGTPNQETYEITVDGDMLTFKTKSSECPPCIAINTANPWKRVE